MSDSAMCDSGPDFQNTDRETRLALARDEQTPAELLQQLAQAKDSEIRQSVARNPNTPLDLLIDLGEDFPEAVVANPIFTLLLLENPDDRFVRLCLARSSTTSTEVLTNLAQVPDQEVLCAVADNSNTPAAVLEQLIKNPPEYERKHPKGRVFVSACDQRLYYDLIPPIVARNPNTPVSLLTHLMEVHDTEIYLAIAKNPNTPAAMLEQLFNAYSGNYLSYPLAQHPNTPAAVLEQIAGDDNEALRRLVRTHPNVSEQAIALIEFVEGKAGMAVERLEELAQHHSVAVRRAVASSPQTPASALERLSSEYDEQTILHIAQHPNTSATALENVAKSLLRLLSTARSGTVEPIATALLNHANMTDAVLETLIPILGIRVALHPKASSNVLLKLAQQQGKSRILYLYEGLARHRFWQHLLNHPQTPAEVLEMLFARLIETRQIALDETLQASRHRYFLRIAQHPNTPAEILLELTAINLELRRVVGQHPAAPAELLRQLANEADAQTVSAVAANRNSPVDVLMNCLSHADERVRQQLAGNRAAPLAVLETLTQDQAAAVRAAVAERSDLPEALVEQLAGDPDPAVRHSLSKTLARSPERLARLVATLIAKLGTNQVESNRVRPAAVADSQLDQLSQFATDPDPRIRENVLHRADLPEAILEQLAETTLSQLDRERIQDSHFLPELRVLERLAQHPHTPIRILDLLAANQPACLYQRFREGMFFGLRQRVAENITSRLAA